MEKDFLQSEAWRSFQESFGRKSVALQGPDFSGFGFLQHMPLFGAYLYFPHGPILKEGTEKEAFSQILRKEAREKNARFIRVEPQTEGEKILLKDAFGRHFVKAPQSVQPEEIFVIDITSTEEELLSRMKGKTRYNIRLAEKHGVRVFETREKKYREAFLDLMEKTAERKEIRPHPRAYYKAFFHGLPEEMCRLFVAELDGEVLAANLLIFFEGTVTYLHGGSSDLRRDAMAPYLLQWQGILSAKGAGAEHYDFGGVKKNTKTKSGKNWDGITRFKLGFSRDTEPLLLPGTYDIILDTPVYSLYTFLRKLRRAFRAFGI